MASKIKSFSFDEEKDKDVLDLIEDQKNQSQFIIDCIRKNNSLEEKLNYIIELLKTKEFKVSEENDDFSSSLLDQIEKW